MFFKETNWVFFKHLPRPHYDQFYEAGIWKKMENQGNCFAMDWWAFFFILLLVYQHVSVTEFLNLQSVDTYFAQINAFFQVDNTPLWQNWVSSIMNWSVCCSERNSIPVFPGNVGISQCERCTWSWWFVTFSVGKINFM